MGKLKFTILSMKALETQFYSIIGKWELTRTVGNLSGHYTLLLKKINGEWKIISDHSS
jgi:ketosteroid isomerase-like protein